MLPRKHTFTPSSSRRGRKWPRNQRSCNQRRKDFFYETHIKQLEQKLEKARLREAEKSVEITNLKTQVGVLAETSVREESQFTASVGESPLMAIPHHLTDAPGLVSTRRAIYLEKKKA